MLDMILDDFPGMLSIKDSELNYVKSNGYLSRLYGYKNPDAIVGTTDFDLKCHAVESAPLFKKQDLEVLNKKDPILTIDHHSYADGNTHLFLTQKFLSNNSKLSRNIIALSTELTNQAQVKKLLTEFFSKKAEKHVYSDTISVKYTFSNDLSSADSEVIYYLLQGKTAKEIAQRIYRSYRTVEHRIEKIRHKLNCSNKPELIIRCIELGYHKCIPRSLLTL